MCNSCEVLNINGINCHEHGCPNGSNKNTRCVSCDEKYLVREMHQNEHGSGYTCVECIEEWDKEVA